MIIIITSVMIMITISIIIIIVTIIILIIINISVSRAQPPAQLGGKPSSVIYMNGTVQLAITIANALSPYRSASGLAFCLFKIITCSHLAHTQLCLQRCMGTIQLAPAPLVRSF